MAQCPICGVGMFGSDATGWIDTYDGLPHDPINHSH